jgi:hypothetical protein
MPTKPKTWSEQIALLIQWPVKFIKFPDVWCANTISSPDLKHLACLTLLTTPQVTPTLPALLGSVILHETTAPFTLSHQ